MATNGTTNGGPSGNGAPGNSSSNPRPPSQTTVMTALERQIEEIRSAVAAIRSHAQPSTSQNGANGNVTNSMNGGTASNRSLQNATTSALPVSSLALNAPTTLTAPNTSTARELPPPVPPTDLPPHLRAPPAGFQATGLTRPAGWTRNMNTVAIRMLETQSVDQVHANFAGLNDRWADQDEVRDHLQALLELYWGGI
ncbi:uncharacterized protein KY384_003887 [Bacidia gigantensis]|uniref:uncharacterized protein n=1 Tax=Bacidia gigantensis TaxID=2732470 RepID=UPI001D03967B|nr:uncharacterized protein KY384_003887 [Bacidia gigantensis]KAG8532246.1 hypothetical protein KY384_003887 [Bacidia gigantensis]